MLKEYYRLAKPGIVYGNLMTAVAAYLYASRWELDTPLIWVNFLATMVGIGLVIASACVFNNYLDRDIDAKMERTKDRALASGSITNTNGVLYAIVLGALGFTLLIAFVNVWATVFAALGFIVYIFAYTFLKRKTEWATEIGSIAGAAPIVVGYTAALGRFDQVALILFLIMVFWQMPHFYSIAIRRSGEYADAGIPVLPLKKGTRETKLRMLFYMFLFGLAVFALTYFHYAGYAFLIVTEIAALAWFWRGTEGFGAFDETAWARKTFLVSLAVLLVFCAMLALSPYLP